MITIMSINGLNYKHAHTYVRGKQIVVKVIHTAFPLSVLSTILVYITRGQQPCNLIHNARHVAFSVQIATHCQDEKPLKCHHYTFVNKGCHYTISLSFFSV